METIKCILQDNERGTELRIKDKEKEVWSPRDGDGTWGTYLESDDLDEINFISDDDFKRYFNCEEVEINVPISFWENKGYTVRVVKKFNGTPETVIVPLTLDSIAYVACPYCSQSRSVEPDANYTVECEGCGDPYKIESMI